MEFSKQPEYISSIKSVVIPPRLQDNLRLGIDAIDDLFGDGITPGTVTLLTGLPGKGKSTLAYMLADAATGEAMKGNRLRGAFVVFNGLEQNHIVMAKRWKQMGLPHGFAVCSYSSVDSLIERATKEIRENCGPVSRDGFPAHEAVVFVDSLRYLTIPRPKGQRGRTLSAQNMAIAAMEKLVTWAKDNFVTLFVIGHVTKNGKFAGKQELMHMVDCHLHLTEDSDKESLTFKKPVAVLLKNRIGPTGQNREYSLSKTGIEFLDSLDMVPEDEDSDNGYSENEG